MNKDGWYHKKLKTYSYKGKTVKAVNKTEAKDRLGLKGNIDETQIKKVKS
jgi:hypothetical protein